MRLNDFKLTEHFNLSEFQCPCCHSVRLSPQLVLKLEAVKQRWGNAIIINSGYRCASHNKEVGGAAASLHRQGLAADVRIRREDQERFRRIAASEGFTRVIMYGDRGFIHLETGGNI